MNIDFLCRTNLTKGFKALNIKPYFFKEDESHNDSVEIVADLKNGLPLSDSSVDIFLASDVLNTVDDFVFIMKEIHRVCKTTSVVIIKTPYAGSVYAYNPFAKHHFNVQTFYFFDDRSPYYDEKNELPKFHIVNCNYSMLNKIELELEVVK